MSKKCLAPFKRQSPMAVISAATYQLELNRKSSQSQRRIQDRRNAWTLLFIIFINSRNRRMQDMTKHSLKVVNTRLRQALPAPQPPMEPRRSRAKRERSRCSWPWQASDTDSNWAQAKMSSTWPT